MVDMSPSISAAACVRMSPIATSCQSWSVRFAASPVSRLPATLQYSRTARSAPANAALKLPVAAAVAGSHHDLKHVS